MQGEKVTKASVNYGPAKSSSRDRCGNCTHFVRRYAECERVQGHINAGDWCELWAARNG